MATEAVLRQLNLYDVELRVSGIRRVEKEPIRYRSPERLGLDLFLGVYVERGRAEQELRRFDDVVLKAFPLTCTYEDQTGA